MKKIIAILLALVLCLSLPACGGEESAASAEPVATKAAATEPATEYVPLEVELCAEYAIETLKNNLKKPDSLQIYDLFGVETEDSCIIAIQYSAQNSFGDAVNDNLFLDILITENGYGVRTYGSGSFEEEENQKYTAQFCAKNKKRHGYYIFDAQSLRVSAFVESEVTAEIVEFAGKLKGENDSYEGAWNVQIGDDNYLKVVYFTEDTDLSWYEQFTGKPYEVTISALLEEGKYYDATIVADPVLDATHEERFQRFNYHDRVYYKTFVQELIPMTEEETGTALTGNTFTMRNNYGGDNNGNHTVTFFDDGTMDAGYTYEGESYTMYDSWRIEGGNVIVGNPNGYEEILTPYRFDETRILLMNMDPRGDTSMILTVSA